MDSIHVTEEQTDVYKDTEKKKCYIIHLNLYFDQLQSKKKFIRLFTVLNVQFECMPF